MLPSGLRKKRSLTCPCLPWKSHIGLGQLFLVGVEWPILLLLLLIPPCGFVSKTCQQQQQAVLRSQPSQSCLNLKQVNKMVDIFIQDALEKLFSFEGDPWSRIVTCRVSGAAFGWWFKGSCHHPRHNGRHQYGLQVENASMLRCGLAVGKRVPSLAMESAVRALHSPLSAEMHCCPLP